MKLNIYLVLTLFFLIDTTSYGQQITYKNSGEIYLAMSKFNTLGTVLYIAAHPDDENTRLLSYLANGRKLRTVYLSLTRGDGGQNLIGKEQGSELGMIRTQELMAARRTDRAEQYFTRANDFGYSKNPDETFSIWNKEEILSDVVWAIRKFRPDVIINRFPTTGEGGHGHHTASAILSVEAFKAAADPLRFPEQLKYVTTWQAKRLFTNSFVPRDQTVPDRTNQLQVDVGGYNPFLGASYGEIAADSRTMHKSQGFGVPHSRGTMIEYFKKLDGDTLVNEIMEGIDTTWNRVQGGNGIEKNITQIIEAFDPASPEKSVPQLIALLNKLKLVKNDYWREYKSNQIKELIKNCTGLYFEANARNYFASPGDTFSTSISAISRMGNNIKLENVLLNDIDTNLSMTLSRNEMFTFNKTIRLSSASDYTSPFWLKEQHGQDAYVIHDLTNRGEPWNDDVTSATFVYTINGEKISYKIPITYKWTDPVKGELFRQFEIVPPVSIMPSDEVLVLNSYEPKIFHLKIKSATDSIKGKLKMELPFGYTITPSESDFELFSSGNEKNISFTISASSSKTKQPLQPSTLKVWVEVNGNKYDDELRRIDYDHIHPMTLIKKCEIKLVPLDLKTTVKKIGYIEGAGDQVAKCLTQAGFDVVILNEDDVLNGSLDQFGAIIIGIRAYNTLENIGKYYEPLMKYVSDGGNLIVQYNTSNFLSSINSNIGPYPFKISRDRVTVETAPVTFVDPENSLLNSPNKITSADFDGWIQERGLYFATDLAPEYKTLLSWNDPGEKPLTGGLIYTSYGKGNFIYTGISFFRELPAGVPGAYRLITNLINAGK